MKQYRRRDSFFDRTERIYELESDRILEVRPQKTREIFYDDIVEFRLCYLPTEEKPNRYMTTIKNTRGMCIQFDNMHYRAKGGLEERSGDYRDFVLELVEKIREAKPELLVRSGGARWYYGLRLAEGLGLAAIVLAGIYYIPMTDGWISVVGGLKALSLLLILPLFVRWAIKIKPKLYKIMNLPDRVVPQPQSALAA